MKTNPTNPSLEEEIRSLIEPEVEAAQGTSNYNWAADGRNQRELYIGGITEDIAALVRRKLEVFAEDIQDLCGEYDGKSDTGEVDFNDLRLEIGDILTRHLGKENNES